MNDYPSSLPPPQQRGYSCKIRPNMIRTQMADGHVRQRLVNTGAPHELAVTFMFTQTQYQEFMSWYRNDISSGQDWFRMKLLNEYGGTESVCRIQNGELSASLNCVNGEGPLWSVQCRLDMEPGSGNGSGGGGDEVWIDPEGWDELYAFIYVPYADTEPSWPGVKLEKNSQGYYVLSMELFSGIPCESTVEFHNNHGKYTYSIYLFEANDWPGRIIRVREYESEVEYVT